MNLQPTNDLFVATLKGIFGDEPFLGVVRACEAIDDYYRKQRYDDNAKLMLVNAFRLYEQGKMSKDQLKAVIDLLPNNTTVEIQDGLVSVLNGLLK